MKNKGITLIALIVIIILLLILAGIVINLAIGENGLFEIAKNAGEEYKIAGIREIVEAEILAMDAEKITKGETLTKEQALIGINEKGTFEEINLEESTGTIQGYTVTLGYNQNGKVVIKDIIKGVRARITIKIKPEEYTNKNVEIEIGVKPEETKITNIEIPEGITKNENGKYEVSKNGIYIVKVVLENGETLEEELKIETIDKLPPKPFTITANTTETSIIITGETVDEEATNENACSGIDRYEYIVVDESGKETTYTTNEIIGLEAGKYQVYMIAYDKVGNPMPAEAKEVVIKKDWEYTITDGKVVLTKYVGTDTEVIVPKKHEVNGVEYDVEIGDTIFKENRIITKVTLQDNCTEIPDSMFDNCIDLKNVIIPSTVKSIGRNAFRYSGITNITIPNGVTKINTGTFQFCTKLVSINIPSSVTEIGEDAFRGCEKLTTITIPDTVTKIYNYAFFGSSLTSVKLPQNLTKLGNNAFRNCKSLKKAWIPKSLQYMEGETFSATTGVTIYCEATAAPSGWKTGWNNDNTVKYNITASQYNRY